MPYHFTKAITFAIGLGLLALPSQIFAQDMESEAVRQNLRPNLSDDPGIHDPDPGPATDVTVVPGPEVEEEVGESEAEEAER